MAAYQETLWAANLICVVGCAGMLPASPLPRAASVALSRVASHWGMPCLSRRPLSSAASLARFPRSVRLVEVGPRDGLQVSWRPHAPLCLCAMWAPWLHTGLHPIRASQPRCAPLLHPFPALPLQNERTIVPTDVKVEFINRLSDTGLRSIEATSFVSAKWVPQMGDNASVLAGITRAPGVAYPVLTPNIKGFEAALEAGATEVAIFAAASDTFSMKNINCNVRDSFERFRPLTQAAAAAGVRVRGCVTPFPCVCSSYCELCLLPRFSFPSTCPRPVQVCILCAGLSLRG